MSGPASKNRNASSPYQEGSQESRQESESSPSDEAWLASSHAVLTATIESLPDAIVAMDLSDNVIGYNNRFVDMWKMSREFLDSATSAQIIEHSMRLVKDPAHLHALVTSVKDTAAIESREHIEMKDGRTFQRHARPLYSHGVLKGRLSSWHDVTELRRTESALKESEERFRMLWETAPDAVVMLDEHGIIQYANAAIRQVFGHEPASMIGKDIAIIQPERLRELHRQGLSRYLKTGKRNLNWRATEAVGLHCDGHEIPLEISFSHMEVGGVHRFAGFLRDIGERKRTEQERQMLEEQLRESQKMEAIGTLAGGIAHDFNNILGAILGNVALARQELNTQHAARVSLEEIYKAGVRAKHLVEQILAFSRKQPQAFVDQPLQPLIEETLGLLRITMPASVSLEAQLPSTPIFVRADTVQLEQVIMNLCTNAWHALKDEVGKIEVSLDEVTVDSQRATLLALTAGRYARLVVTDDGHGMDEATLSRVFEPFYTTKQLHKGTGLGLAVAHGIAKTHHGAITVKSALNRGTSFEVLIPAVPPTTQPTKTVIAAAITSGQGQHILYVDDDEAMVFLVQRMLSSLGYRVSAFQDAAVALDAVRTNPQDFDLIVTDFNMPGASGLDVAHELARIRADLPVVITSGFINEKLQAGALAAGVRHLVHKPNTIDELCGIIQRLITEDSNKHKK